MNRFRFAFLLALAAALFLVAPSSAAEYSGLWVGTATIKAVSEVNQREPDLSFDLGLEGIIKRETLINRGDTWKYYDSNVDPGYIWRYPDYNDSNWLTGPAPIGYGTDSNTVISYGADPNPNPPTTYFRKSFNLDDPNNYGSLRLRVWRDDGIVIYLNGQEIMRNNLSTSYVDFSSLAISEIEDNTYFAITIPATLLTGGNNCLAAEVHLASEDDSDLLFDLELTASVVSSSNTELIAFESADWLYYDAQEEIDDPNGWYKVEYNDSNWDEGQAQFGYGEGDEKTTLTYSSSQKSSTTYFRKEFSLPDDSDYTHLRLMLLADEGAVAYLNGTEIQRANMPAGTIKYDTSPVKAIGSAEENRYLVEEIDLAEEGFTLQQTGNVLAVEVHQHPGELGDPNKVPTSTPATFDLRLLLHVDSAGIVRLLKEVIQMYDEENNNYVLLTDDTLIPEYSGVALRDGKPVGRRLSSVGFDFDGNSVDCTGVVSATGKVECSFTLDSSHPTNPFLHRYHPDHDNLDARYEHFVKEAYSIQRDITIDFDDRYPPDQDEPEWPDPPPGWGYSSLGGYYTETLKGLHKDDITVSGPFLLERLSNIDSLNP